MHRTRLVLIAALWLVAVPAAMGQFLSFDSACRVGEKWITVKSDAVTRRVKEWLEPRVPRDAKVSVNANLSYSITALVSLNESTDAFALSRLAGKESTDAREAIGAWAEFINRDLVPIVTEYVRESGHDPDFNPELDSLFVVDGYERTDGSDKRFFRIFHTGTNVRSPLDSKGVDPGGPGLFPGRGGEITIEIKPDHEEYEPRETITGTVTLRNTGKSRVNVGVRLRRELTVTDPAGLPLREHQQNAEARQSRLFDDVDEVFGRWWFIPWPFDPNARVLPGESLEVRFQIFTDPLQDSGYQRGYELTEGDWILRAKTDEFENVVTTTQPVRIRVKAKEGVRYGPRILSMRGAGRDLLIGREDHSLELL